jgi:hypothetical protein
MKKFLLCLLFLASAQVFAQGVFVPPQVALKTVNGVTMPIAGATITVCAASSGGIPCSPALSNTIFKDAALSQPLSNPFTADSNGNYTFAVAAGNYTVTVSAAGFAGNSYQISSGLVAGGGLSYPGIFSPATTMYLNFTDNINNLNFLTEFQIDQSLGFATEGESVGVAVPSTATVRQENAIGSYITTACNSSTRTVCNAVGIYPHARVTGTGGAAWGANPLVSDTHGVSGANLTSIEADLNVAGTPAYARGVTISICDQCSNSGTGTVPAHAAWGIEIGGNAFTGNGRWTDAIHIDRAQGTDNGIFLDGASTVNPSNSQRITFTGYNSGGVAGASNIQADQNGNLLVTTPGAFNLSFPNVAGTILASGNGNGNHLQTLAGTSGCATAASIGAACSTTITWANAFGDNSYTVLGCVGNGVTSGTPIIQAITSKLAGSIAINTVALTANIAQFTTIECSAVHP